jgi:hypothetical protein
MSGTDPFFNDLNTSTLLRTGSAQRLSVCYG